ncbi:MAG: tRNA (adenosine(37)-N6)-threonylcarbamoyltransferase complex dimerization subunit type 1 TsaB [Desulfovibrio sp.]|nr:tRNA (adenosine(37)-N6)-threonylcarbamoyltransferase complex dimerization subunit type 1 TsaB [Desulfovibrio sp.]
MTVYGTGPELILNACEGVLQIGLTNDEIPLCFEEWRAPGRATEILAPALKEICERTGIKPRDFRRIACVAGPGSFTGIRLILTTAAALRRTSAAQLAGLNYLQALATTASIWRGLLYPARIRVITRARRDLVCYQEYIAYGPQIPAQSAGEIMLLSPAAARAKFLSDPCFVCGSGLSFFPPAPDEDFGEAILMRELNRPGFDSLRLLARHGDYFSRDIEPLYIRPCDAAENVASLAEKRGGDGEDARAKLEACLNRDPLDPASLI